MRVERARKSLYRGPPDRIVWGISLGLDVNDVQAKRVEFYHSVNAAVARTAEVLRCFVSGASVSHSGKQFDDKALEEGGR